MLRHSLQGKKGMNPLDNVLQGMPKMPKFDRVLPQINIPPSLNPDKSNKKTIIIISVAILVVVLIIVSTFLLLSGERKEITPAVKPTPAVTQTPKYIPSPTPYYPQTTPSPSPTPSTPCGNGAVDTGEGCDGNNFAGQSCESLRGSNYEGSLSCTSTCKVDVTSCKLKRIISVRGSTTLPPLTQTSGSAPAPNAVKVNDAVKLSNSVRLR